MKPRRYPFDEVIPLALEHDDPHVREAAIRSLGIVLHPRSRLALLHAAAGDPLPFNRRQAVAYLSLHMESAHEALTLAHEALDGERDPDVRAGWRELAATHRDDSIDAAAWAGLEDRHRTDHGGSQR